MSDDDMTQFKKSVEEEKKNVNAIKAYSNLKSQEVVGSTDEEKEANKQF